jgi:hypothetical protein
MTYIPVEIRRLVTDRAGGYCEYCRMNVSDRLLPFQIDHVIAEKHGGDTEADNLCVACFRCNSFKGSDIASIDPLTKQATFLFNLRKQAWDLHLRLSDAFIEPLTPEGRVTAFLLRFNIPIHITQRKVLMQSGHYPCESM